MYGDFSRMTFSRGKAYTGVWSQQGRVQLDADANEQTAILLDWLRTLAVDFIGPFGGHVTRSGFNVGLQADDLTFSPGHYYVYGLRCEIPQLADPSAPGATYRGLVSGAGALPTPPYLVQLLVWERSVSAVADPGLLEPALGPHPPDTTVRSQVAWVPAVSTTLPDGTQLAAAALNAEFVSGVFEEYNAAGSRARPLLAARVETDVETEEASIVPATSGYLGVENQLYRVEVHTGSTDAAGDGPTFKWSRENASAEFRIVAPGAETRTSAYAQVGHVTVASLGRDARTGLDVGDWVELIDDTWVPQGNPPPLAAVQAIDRGGLTVTLSAGLEIDMSLHPYLRRWDQTADSPAGQDGIPIAEGTWLELEDGVQVSFSANGAGYQRGDYWLIPARTATGGLLWPGEAGQPSAVPPAGPARYLVPLALVTNTTTAEDMRTLFTHLAWPPEPSGASAAGQEA
jgi:hypothetical protein